MSANKIEKRDRKWVDPFTGQLPVSPIPLPDSASALMLALDTLPYAARNAYVSRLGRDQAENPKMAALIEALRKVLLSSLASYFIYFIQFIVI